MDSGAQGSARLIAASIAELHNDSWVALEQWPDWLVAWTAVSYGRTLDEILAEHEEALISKHALAGFAPVSTQISIVGGDVTLGLLYEGPAFQRPTLARLIFGISPAPLSATIH